GPARPAACWDRPDQPALRLLMPTKTWHATRHPPRPLHELRRGLNPAGALAARANRAAAGPLGNRPGRTRLPASTTVVKSLPGRPVRAPSRRRPEVSATPLGPVPTTVSL